MFGDVDLAVMSGWGVGLDQQLGHDCQRGIGACGVCLAVCLVWGVAA